MRRLFLPLLLLLLHIHNTTMLCFRHSDAARTRSFHHRAAYMRARARLQMMQSTMSVRARS